MTTAVYFGVGGVARKVSKMYVGVGGVARKVSKGYIGVGGVARLFFKTEHDSVAMSTAREISAATNNGSYVIFPGGLLTGGSSYSTVVEAYNSSLTCTQPTNMGNYVRYLSAERIGSYAVFAGGGTQAAGTSYSTFCRAYNTSLTQSTPTSLPTAKYSMATACLASTYALFVGGSGNTSQASTNGAAYNSSLTMTSVTDTSFGILPDGQEVGNYAVIAGGRQIGEETATYYSTCYTYNSSLTRSSGTAMSTARYQMSTATIGSYAIFAGGSVSDSTYTSVVNTYNESLSRSTAADLSTARAWGTVGGGAAVSGSYALFAGSSSSSAVVDTYNSSLTHSTAADLSQGRETCGSAVDGVAMFGCSTSYGYMDVYEL